MRTLVDLGRLLVSLGLGAALSACAGAQGKAKGPADLSPSSLYPLRLSAAWSYDVDSGDGQPVLAVARVTRSEGSMVEVATGNDAAIGYVLQSDGIARAGAPSGTYLLKAPIAAGATWSSGEGTTARVAELGVALRTPAGNFADCVRVQEDNASSGQHVTTTYCPGVGPALVVSEMEVRGQQLRVTATLRGYATDE